MGSPTIGGDITGSVLEGSGAIVTGDLDDINPFTDNNDDTWSITSAASYGSATINATTGAWSYDLNDTHPTVKALDPGDTLTDTFTVRMLDDDGRADTQVVTITINGAVFFTAGTLIDTARGPCPVERLTPGQKVQTADHGLQPIRWIGQMRFDAQQLRADPRLRPVRVAPGALAPGCPERALRVSRQHRLLITGDTVSRVFGCDEVLVPAIRLVGLPGIEIDRTDGDVRYFHILFDSHEIVFGNGAPSESFLLGPQALKTLSEDSLDEIAALFPEISMPEFEMPGARPLARDRRQVRSFLRSLSAAGGFALEHEARLLA